MHPKAASGAKTPFWTFYPGRVRLAYLRRLKMPLRNLLRDCALVVGLMAGWAVPAVSQILYPGGFVPPGGYVPIDPRFPAYPFSAPRSVLIESQVVPAAPLPPARIVLTHRQNETLRVEIYDQKKRQTIFQNDIPAGQSIEVTLPRDAGGVVHETYQSVGPFGDIVQRNITRNIPIDVRYEVIVHQWQIQSIAIDRTGKSPSQIEDIQYQGKGIGRFTLPAGPQLTDGQIDVYRNAVAAGNRGAIAPLLPSSEDDRPASDPLRRALEELERR
jgi:hypothetical protein